MVVATQGLHDLCGSVVVPLHSHDLVDSKEGEHLSAQQQLQQRLPAVVQMNNKQRSQSVLSHTLKRLV